MHAFKCSVVCLFVCLLYSVLGHSKKECTGEAKEKEGEFDEMANTGVVQEKEFIFIRIPILKEV